MGFVRETSRMLLFNDIPKTIVWKRSAILVRVEAVPETSILVSLMIYPAESDRTSYQEHSGNGGCDGLIHMYMVF